MKTDQYPKLRAFLRSLSQEDQEQFAARCETSVNYLRKAMSKASKMDVHLVEKIVVESGFAVPPEELRKDVNWEVFADASVVRALSDPAQRGRLRGKVAAVRSVRAGVSSIM